MNENTNEMSQEFVEKKESKNYIIVVAILYVVVITLTILLIFGIKHQKDTVKKSVNTESNNVIKKQETNKKTNTKDTIENKSSKEETTDIHDYLGQ